MSIQLRKTTLNDIAWVVVAERHPDNCNYVYQWDDSLHRAALDAPDLVHLIIEEVNTQEKVGYIILDEMQNSSRSINLRRLVITRKNKGIGKQALDLIQKYVFEELHAHRLWLDVFCDNLTAYQLYKKVGFVTEGTLRESYLRAGKYASQYIMSVLKHEYLDGNLEQT